MMTKYGEVQYICESVYGEVYFIYGIKDGMIKVGTADKAPKISLLRQNTKGQTYFMKSGERVYLDNIEELHVY